VHREPRKDLTVLLNPHIESDTPRAPGESHIYRTVAEADAHAHELFFNLRRPLLADAPCNSCVDVLEASKMNLWRELSLGTFEGSRACLETSLFALQE
jgi:hypothetical protein